ncbi:hypothetical protein L7F22_026093, partial [Adiantum nelumboides]|nr:hypothetical protein [Adiantum nelumboides]
SNELVVQESMMPDRHVERSCSRDARRCKSSTRQMALIDDLVIQRACGYVFFGWSRDAYG